MAELSGEPYEPGGVAEADELIDLFAIWKEQDEKRPKGGGLDKSAADLWIADSFESRGVT